MIKFILSQPSTIRGIVWTVASVVSLLFLTFSSIEKAMTVMSIAGTVVGGLGMALNDPEK